MRRIQLLSVAIATVILSAPLGAQQLPREQWGAMPVTVTHTGGKWIITGKNNKVTLNEADLALQVHAGGAQWDMLPSAAGDMLVKAKGEGVSLRLADARSITIVPYD